MYEYGGPGGLDRNADAGTGEPFPRRVCVLWYSLKETLVFSRFSRYSSGLLNSLRFVELYQF